MREDQIIVGAPVGRDCKEAIERGQVWGRQPAAPPRQDHFVARHAFEDAPRRVPQGHDPKWGEETDVYSTF